MKKALLLLLLSASPAFAQYEMEGRNFLVPTVQCPSTPISANRVIAYPPDLPPEGIAITQIHFGDNAGTFPPNGSYEVQLDRGGRWSAAAGYPQTQHAVTYPLITLVQFNVVPAGQFMFQDRDLIPPVMWRPGDLLIVVSACTGSQPMQPIINIHFQVPYNHPILGPLDVRWDGQPLP